MKDHQKHYIISKMSCEVVKAATEIRWNEYLD